VTGRYTEHRTLEAGPLLVADSTMESGERKVWLGAGGLEGRWVTHAEFRAIVGQLVTFADALPPAGGVKTCRYTSESGGACWRQGKAVELCTCHAMTDEAFRASARAHAADGVALDGGTKA
jgi:hypothetical protein